MVTPLRRLHRKIVLIDKRIAIVGGLNIGDDYYRWNKHEYAKTDFALCVEGSIVKNIVRFTDSFFARLTRDFARYFRNRFNLHKAEKLNDSSQSAAMFIVRDNFTYRRHIEKFYLKSLDAARTEVILAFSYFFPNKEIIRALERTARRGVKVSLILQGKPEFFIVKAAASLLYQRLMASGVTIYEYEAAILHAKVAVFDSETIIVGSFNMDPFSLMLNLEANLTVREPQVAQKLAARLNEMIERESKQVEDADIILSPLMRVTLTLLGSWFWAFIRNAAKLKRPPQI